jgi:hypothetical protein
MGFNLAFEELIPSIHIPPYVFFANHITWATCFVLSWSSSGLHHQKR